MNRYQKLAEAWLRQHGLADAALTPMLVSRLAVRFQARTLNSLMLAALFIVASLTQVYAMVGDDRPLLPVVLAVTVAGMLAGQLLLDRWVRRVDQRLGATLSRRATHPVHPGWRAVVGRPHATLLLLAFAGAATLALSALPVLDSTERYAALVLLTGVCGLGAVVAVKMRHLLALPVVADDETSLTADVIMRIEEARDTNAPAVLWSMPVVLVFGFAPAWWGAAAMTFLVVGSAALIVVQLKTPRVDVAARRVVGVQ